MKSHDEINDILPEKLTNSDKIDDVFILLNQYGIEIVEEYVRKGSERLMPSPKSPQLLDFAIGEQKVPKTLIEELQRMGYELKVPEKGALNIQDLAIQMMNKGYDIETLSQLLQRPEFRPTSKKETAAATGDDPIGFI